MNDRIKLMVAHLLEKTVANGCTEAEQDAATAKIQELLSKYRISMSEVESTVLAEDVEVDVEVVCGGRSSGSWMSLLASGVARANGCDAFRRGSDRRILIYGTRANRELAVWMFHHLRTQIDAMTLRNAAGRGRRFAGGYRQGLAVGAARRVAAAAEAAKASAGSTALATLRRDAEGLAVFAHQQRITGGRRVYRADAMGYERGHADAANLGMGRPIGGRAPRQIAFGGER